MQAKKLLSVNTGRVIPNEEWAPLTSVDYCQPVVHYVTTEGTDG